MKYQLWEIIYDGATEMPLVLIDENIDFGFIYRRYLNMIKQVPCAIFIKGEK